MTGTATLPPTSPDGRFAISVRELDDDRGCKEYETWLVDVAAKRDVVWLANAITGGFQPDGMLRIVRPPWNAWDVLVDPARECFRIRDDQPWLPLTAWGLGWSAYRRGWAEGINFRATDPELKRPVVDASIAVAAIVFVALLAWKPWLDVVPRVTLISIGALVAVLFTWLAGNAWRSWRRMPDLRPQVQPNEGGTS